MWQCNGKYRDRAAEKCQTPHLTDEQISRAFVEAFNRVAADRERTIAALEPMLAVLSDTADLDNEAEILAERSAGIYTQMEALVAENARRLQDQAEYLNRYEALNTRYEEVRARLGEIAAERQSRLAKRESIRQFMDTVRQRDALLTGFDEPLFRATVDTVIVHSLDDVRVKFRDGREISVAVE